MIFSGGIFSEGRFFVKPKKPPLCWTSEQNQRNTKYQEQNCQRDFALIILPEICTYGDTIIDTLYHNITSISKLKIKLHLISKCPAAAGEEDVCLPSVACLVLMKLMIHMIKLMMMMLFVLYEDQN